MFLADAIMAFFKARAVFIIMRTEDDVYLENKDMRSGFVLEGI